MIMEKFTVIGEWAGEIPTALAVVRGDHAVTHVFDQEPGDGTWSVCVDAPDARDAADIAAHGMLKDPERIFIVELSDLRHRAGRPSARKIAEAIGTISQATVSKIVGAKAMHALWGTRWEQAAKIVNHLGGDVDRFHRLWDIGIAASHEGAQRRAAERIKREGSVVDRMKLGGGSAR